MATKRGYILSKVPSFVDRAAMRAFCICVTWPVERNLIESLALAWVPGCFFWILYLVYLHPNICPSNVSNTEDAHVKCLMFWHLNSTAHIQAMLKIQRIDFRGQCIKIWCQKFSGFLNSKSDEWHENRFTSRQEDKSIQEQSFQNWSSFYTFYFRGA